MLEFPDPPEFSIPMTAERLRWCLDVIGWSKNEFANRLTVSHTTGAQWANGRRNIPNRVAIWIDSLAQVHLALPEPYLWGTDDRVGRTRHANATNHQMLERAWDDPLAAYTEAEREEGPSTPADVAREVERLAREGA
jgi:transcriptional regulator with XRE-family HTH domain